MKPVVFQPPHMRPFLDDKVCIEAAFRRASRQRGSAWHKARGTRIIFTKKKFLFSQIWEEIFDFLCHKSREKHIFEDKKSNKREKNNLRISIEADLELEYSSMMDYCED